MIEVTPYWISDCGRATVYVGDCMQVMMHLPREVFHAIVTDPPYNLGFMGREWDTVGDGRAFQQWLQDRSTQMLRTAKPGAHLLCFGGTRMYHRAACAVEDSGFEVRDTIMWVYGSGFCKSMNVSKAIDEELGFATKQPVEGRERKKGNFVNSQVVQGGYNFRSEWEVRKPITDAAKQWEGWGTCLKPALEPIVMARKPHIGTVASNTLEHGCGGLNMEACKVGSTGASVIKEMTGKKDSGSGIYRMNDGTASAGIQGGFLVETTDGRLPTNLIHDGGPEVLELLGDSARFFYCAKADEDDRPHGRNGAVHPTVKPLDLMKYLVRMVCVKGGTVLDPFMGSGSTGCAAVEEGVYFVGIEQDQKYADMAVGRLKLSLYKSESVERASSGRPKPGGRGRAPRPTKMRD